MGENCYMSHIQLFSIRVLNSDCNCSRGCGYVATLSIAENCWQMQLMTMQSRKPPKSWRCDHNCGWEPQFKTMFSIKEQFFICWMVTISGVISFAVAPGLATTLWRRNLSLHCMSGGASFWACIVTKKWKYKHDTNSQLNM